MNALPLWAEILTALFAVVGAAFAAIGSFGLVRLPSFYNRVHAPTLGATAGAWCVMIATIVYFSVQGNNLFLHAVLIAVFVALTAPVTTIFLMRAALFRDRQKGLDIPHAARSRAANVEAAIETSRSRAAGAEGATAAEAGSKAA